MREKRPFICREEQEKRRVILKFTVLDIRLEWVDPKIPFIAKGGYGEHRGNINCVWCFKLYFYI